MSTRKKRKNEEDLSEEEHVEEELIEGLYDRDTLIQIGLNIVKYGGLGSKTTDDYKWLNKNQAQAVKQVDLVGYGFVSDNPFEADLKEFTVSDFMKLGLSNKQAHNKIRRLKNRTTAEHKPMRSDSYKNEENNDTKNLVYQFLSQESVSTISDRCDESILIDGERQSLRFLNQSVAQTYQRFQSEVHVISESLFRKYLILFKDIKTNRRRRRTAVCLKCTQANSFGRSLETFAPESFRDYVKYDLDIDIWYKMFYCNELSSECLSHTCRNCSKDQRMSFFLRKVDWGHMNEEVREAVFAIQVWQQLDGIWTPVVISGSFDELLPRFCLFVEESKIALHHKVLHNQELFFRQLKGFDMERNEVVTIVKKGHVLIKFDQSMRPLTTNSRELQSNHWCQGSIPLQGFIVYFMNSDDEYSKIYCYVTADMSKVSNWDFTSQGFLSVMRYVSNFTGDIRHLTLTCDGAASQAS